MRVKYVVFAALGAILIFGAGSVCKGADTVEIDRIRNKPVLEGGDFQVIDDFVAQSVEELVKSKDFTSVSKIRTAFLSRSSSATDSAAAQYSEQFFESAYKYIALGFEQANTLVLEEYKTKVVINLLIMIDELGDVRLLDMAVKRLNDENGIIRYWAVHCVTNRRIIEQLNSDESANLKMTLTIVERLEGLIEKVGPEELALIAEFGAGIDIAKGEELLGRIADVRIAKYADWSVDYELFDVVVLKLLCEKISSAEGAKAAMARRFGQLYSYAIQRYVKGRELLNDTQRHQLASLLVETEKFCIGKLMSVPQAEIKKAVERGDYTRLLLEHNRLLGDETRAGELSEKLEFDYGKSEEGDSRRSPLALPELPSEK